MGLINQFGYSLKLKILSSGISDILHHRCRTRKVFHFWQTSWHRFVNNFSLAEIKTFLRSRSSVWWTEIGIIAEEKKKSFTALQNSKYFGHLQTDLSSRGWHIFASFSNKNIKCLPLDKAEEAGVVRRSFSRVFTIRSFLLHLLD